MLHQKLTKLNLNRKQETLRVATIAMISVEIAKLGKLLNLDINV